MKILVTGSSGHLGEALCRSLPTIGYEVIGCDRLPSPYTQHVGDLSNAEFVEECMAGVDVIIHSATLHKPHVVTHSKQDFIDSNISATLILLEAAVKHQVFSFIYTSTTSTFGDAMKPYADDPAVWVTEELAAKPKNIYGVTKLAAENLCSLFHRNYGLSCLILKTSRFFLEIDDDPTMRGIYSNDNIKANEFLYRRVDIQDAVNAHVLAMKKAKDIGFAKYIISASSPFTRAHLSVLNQDAPSVIKSLFPSYQEIYDNLNWKMFDRISRVYKSDLAKAELEWEPQVDFNYILDCLKEGKDYRSPVSLEVGIKGYHTQEFDDGPYPV